MKGRFALVRRYEIMREEFVFPEKLPFAYAYPRRSPPDRVYRGLGREERDLYDPLSDGLSPEAALLIEKLEEGTLRPEEVFSDRETTLLFASAFEDAEEYELMYLASPGQEAPEDLALLGFDAGYEPEEELFSALSDLFFFPLWRPDPGGKEFLREFRSLNGAGLFPDPEAVEAFIAHYAAFTGDGALVPLAVYGAPEA